MEQQHRLCYISRNYYNLTAAGNKAKADNEDTLTEMGAVNLGLQRSVRNSKILAFFIDLAGIIRACLLLKRGDTLFLQYPVKKYFTFLCRIAKMKGAKTISLIHDIGSIRTHRLTPTQEVKRLSHSDYILASNTKMTEWLKAHGMKKSMGALGLFDYRSANFNQHNRTFNPQKIKVAYAGALHIKKNPFLIQLTEVLKSWDLYIFGNKNGLQGWKENPRVHHQGFMASDDFIHSVDADFGLVWDGDSLETCSGVFGEYLKWNSPHKVSFYLRSALPVIIWQEAAVASIIEKEGAGFAIKDPQELNERLKTLTPTEYHQMKENAKRLAKELNSGHFLRQALQEYFTSEV